MLILDNLTAYTLQLPIRHQYLRLRARLSASSSTALLTFNIVLLPLRRPIDESCTNLLPSWFLNPTSPNATLRLSAPSLLLAILLVIFAYLLHIANGYMCAANPKTKSAHFRNHG